MKNYESEMGVNDEDEEVECYYDCNGFCVISPCGGQCPFEGGEIFVCENYEEV